MLSICERGCWNLTDETLADQTTNSIQSDDVNMAIQGNVAMQVTQYGGLWNQYKWHHLMTAFQANACGAIWWPNCQIANANGYIWHSIVDKFVNDATE